MIVKRDLKKSLGMTDKEIDEFREERKKKFINKAQNTVDKFLNNTLRGEHKKEQNRLLNYREKSLEKLEDLEKVESGKVSAKDFRAKWGKVNSVRSIRKDGVIPSKSIPIIKL